MAVFCANIFFYERANRFGEDVRAHAISHKSINVTLDAHNLPLSAPTLM